MKYSTVIANLQKKNPVETFKKIEFNSIYSVYHTNGLENHGRKISKFLGICINRSHSLFNGSTLTLRNVVFGVGTEITFFTSAPNIINISNSFRHRSRYRNKRKLFFLRSKPISESYFG